MVKRPKSPEVPEEARFFTVYQPYPVNANWILEDEQKRCAMWVAECIGLNMLWAIHYKPRARGMILLEVSKSFTDHGRLLGEHRWNDILKEPDELEKKSVSQVFHSFYNRLRDCQKDGWKTIPVKTIWFRDWKPGNANIKQPYPMTYWCDTPAEDKTNKPLCRPIPNESSAAPVVLPPPPRPQLPVVGSSKWVKSQGVAAPTPSESHKPAMLEIPPDNFTAREKLGPKSPSPSVPSPRSPGLVRLNSNNTNATSPNNPTFPPTKPSRAKPVPLNSFISGEKKPGKNAWAKPPPSAKFSVTDPVPAAPPVNAWSKKLNIVPSEKNPKVINASTTESKMDYSGWGNPTPSSTPTSEWMSTGTPAMPSPSPLPSPSPGPQSSGLPLDDPPRDKSNKGKGKQREKHGKEKKVGEDPPGEKVSRGAKRDRDPTSPAPTTMDWSADAPGLSSNDWNKPLDMEVDGDVNLKDKQRPPPATTHPSSSSSSFPSSSSFSSIPPPSSSFSSSNQNRSPNKRKPETQFNKDGEPQYELYGEPSERYDSRKRPSHGSWVATEQWYGRKSDRDGDSESRTRTTDGDRGRGRGRGRGGERDGFAERGRGRGGERGRGGSRGWGDAERGGRGRGRGRGRGTDRDAPRDWESSSRGRSGSTNGRYTPSEGSRGDRDRDGYTKRSSHYEPSNSSRNWGDRSLDDDGNKDKDKDADTMDWDSNPNPFGPIPGTSWADMPLSPMGKSGDDDGETEHNPFGPIPGTSWADMPLSPVDKGKKKLDWAEDTDDYIMDKDGHKEEHTHDEPPRSDDTVPETSGPKPKSWEDDDEDENPFARPPDNSAWAAIAAGGNTPKRDVTNSWENDENPFGRPHDTSAWAAIAESAPKPSDPRKKRNDSDNRSGRTSDSGWGGRASNHGNGKNEKPGFSKKGDDHDNRSERRPDSGWAGRASKPAMSNRDHPENPFGKTDDSGWAAVVRGQSSKPAANNRDDAENPFGKTDDSGWAALAGDTPQPSTSDDNVSFGRPLNYSTPADNADDNSRQPSRLSFKDDPWGEPSASANDSDDNWGQVPASSVWDTGKDNDNTWGWPADYSGSVTNDKDPVPVPAWDSILEESLVSKSTPQAELICPTHNIACRKGICRDMAALVRKRNMDNWMAKRGDSWFSRGNGDPAGPSGTVGAKELPNGEIITYKKTRRGGGKTKKPKSSKRTFGVMRGFDDSITAPTYTVGGNGVAGNDVAAGHVNDHESDSEDDR